MTIRTIGFTEAGLQYVIGLLLKQPLGEAGPLFEDIRAQVQAQEAADAAAAHQALVDQVRGELAAETKETP